MEETWSAITDEQIETMIIAIVKTHTLAHRPGLAYNILFHCELAAPPHQAFSGSRPIEAEQRKANRDWAERFRVARVEPVVEKMLADHKLVSDGRYLGAP